ncbi:hypothetical protein [Salmonella enterica]|uniref:YciZ family protein n=1 Tax=Salmonella enterica TaxID=28901 RepID=UPI003857B2D9
MSDIEAQRIAARIDTVLDILVAGDYHSAINNLEILRAELLDQVKDGISPSQAPIVYSLHLASKMVVARKAS